MGSFGTVVVIAFVLSVLLTLTMNAVLRGSVIGMVMSGAFWIVGLIAWAVKHRLDQKEREQLEEEIKRGPAADI